MSDLTKREEYAVRILAGMASLKIDPDQNSYAAWKAVKLAEALHVELSEVPKAAGHSPTCKDQMSYTKTLDPTKVHPFGLRETKCKYCGGVLHYEHC